MYGVIERPPLLRLNVGKEARLRTKKSQPFLGPGMDLHLAPPPEQERAASGDPTIVALGAPLGRGGTAYLGRQGGSYLGSCYGGWFVVRTLFSPP